MSGTRGPVVHYPAGIAGGCHPGVADTCPIAECVQKREKAAAMEAATEAQFDQLAASVRAMQARHDAQVTAAAYRAAADEIEARLRAEGYDLTCACDACTPCLLREHTAHLRNRADQMGQQ